VICSFLHIHIVLYIHLVFYVARSLVYLLKGGVLLPCTVRKRKIVQKDPNGDTNGMKKKNQPAGKWMEVLE